MERERLASASYRMPAPIAHFIAFEMLDFIEALSRLRTVAAVWMGTVVSVLRMEVIIHMAVKTLRTMKPWTCANKYSTTKPLRTVVAVRRAVVRRNVVISIRALRRDSDVDADLGLGFGSSHCKAERSDRR